MGAENVFKDVHSITAGETWRDTINSYIDKSDILLVMIGKNWQAHRLSEEKDTLRDELELAKAAKLTIIPVLLDGAGMPTQDDLPESLRWLPDYQATLLRDADFSYDFERLLKSLGIQQYRKQALKWAAAIGVASISLLVWEAFRPAPTPIDELECLQPTESLLENRNVTQRFLNDQAPLLVSGKLDRSEAIALYPMAQRASSDETLASYMQCQARQNYPFTEPQSSYFNQAIDFISSAGNNSVEDFYSWKNNNPFPGRIPPVYSDIIIAEFDGSQRTEGSFAVANRIESSLIDELTEFNLDNLSVSVLPQMSREEAQKLADKGLNRVVIWGWYDSLDLQIRVMFGQEPEADQDPIVTEVTLELPPSSDATALRSIVSDTLPATATFLSLYLVGQLKYDADEYIEGNRAWDLAMETLPAEIEIGNPALDAFFKARRLQLGLPPR